jgi:hypothetical protein
MERFLIITKKKLSDSTGRLIDNTVLENSTSGNSTSVTSTISNEIEIVDTFKIPDNRFVKDAYIRYYFC